MSGLAICLEEAGLQTTGISLIRLHSERIRPPRALWVPFELGRPLGAPNDVAFQKRVLRAALALLEAPEGPVLQDYPEEAPARDSGIADQDEVLVCALPMPKLPDADAPVSALGQAIMREIAALAPWHELGQRARGRTTVGMSGLSVEAAGRFVARFLEDQAAESPREDLEPGAALKLAYEDLKAYYTEAIMVQPGFGNSARVENWLFDETAFGKGLWKLREICRASEDEFLRFLGGNSIVPDRQVVRREQ